MVLDKEVKEEYGGWRSNGGSYYYCLEPDVCDGSCVSSSEPNFVSTGGSYCCCPNGYTSLNQCDCCADVDQ